MTETVKRLSALEDEVAITRTCHVEARFSKPNHLVFYEGIKTPPA